MTNAIDFAEPLPRTHLSLPRYARIMGVNPVHFAGGAGASIWPVIPNCNDIWPRYAWQDIHRASHEELAYQIQIAEADVARVLAYQVAPTWIENEPIRYPRFYRPDTVRTNMRNVRDQYVSTKLAWGKFIQGGIRAISKIASPSVAALEITFSAEANAGFYDTATIILTDDDLDGLDVNEVKLYFYDTTADPRWEIRPCRSKSISGTTLTAVLDIWLLIDPDLVSMPPTDVDFAGLDLQSDTTNYVTQIDVYREYNDYTEASAILYWEQQPAGYGSCVICGGIGCPACHFTTQNGCIHVRDTNTGIVAITPACYDATEAQWEIAAQSIARDPDQLSVYYYAGEQGADWLRGRSHDPLGQYLAQIIAWIATARLDRPYCACGSIYSYAESLRDDLAEYRKGSTTRFTPESILTNPFGTRKGEVMAWQRVNQLLDNVRGGGAV